MDNLKTYIKPSIKDLGSAKDIIKNQLVTGTGDTFPGVSDALST